MTAIDAEMMRGKEYDDIFRFAKENNNIDYARFDEFVMRDINLFDIPRDDYFKKLEDSLDRMISALPSIKRIFSRPIIRLEDTREIVPVEMVRVIDSYTLSHFSVHTELWGDITKDGIKPKRLMTVEKEETYAIYENIVFCRLVDMMLKFMGRSQAILLDVLYGCKDIQFNLLDRTHHSSYFLALGKLHLEYARAQEGQYPSYFRCLEKMSFIEKTLRSRLGSPIYTACKKKKNKTVLKRTNIFRTHKDYKQVYRLIQWMMNDADPEVSEMSERSVEDSSGYRVYCAWLSIFSAAHFNFAFEKDTLFDFEALDTHAEFSGWRLSVFYENCGLGDVLSFSVKKNEEYKISVLFAKNDSASPKKLEEIRESLGADECLIASAASYGERDVIYLSMFNIDSFRRIQQLILRGMIYSDTEHKVCPFCENPLEQTVKGYECVVCRAEIKKEICPLTEQEYYTSGIRRYVSERARSVERQKFLHDRYAEARLHFRNITRITDEGVPICPRCNKVH